MTRLVHLLLLAASPALAATVAGVEVPPPLPPQPVVDTHWGVKVEDPYRFLENTANPEVQKFMRAQAEATEAILAKIPGRQRMLERIREIDAEVPALVTQVRRDERGGLFYLKREAKDNQYKLYRREGFDGPEKVIVDPEVDAKATGKPHAIGGYGASHDGRYVAYQISAAGTEIGELRVIETETGKEITPRIDRMRGAANWLPDGKGFFYQRMAEGWEKRPRAERYMDVLTYYRRLDDPTKDVAIFGPGLHPEVKINRSTSGVVVAAEGRPIAWAVAHHGVDRNVWLFMADLGSVLAGKPVWREVFDQSAEVVSVAASKDYLYLRTSRDAPRFKLLRTRLPEADPAKAETLIPASAQVITGMGAAKEGLYVTRRDGAAENLVRIAHAPEAKAQPVFLPLEGSVGLAANPRLEGAILTIAGWTRASRHYALGANDDRPSPLSLVPPGKYDAPAGITAREVKVRSHDGVLVPVSIISRTDIELDGSNPTMVYGYGAYGIVEEPSWNPRSLAWLEQGGVIAIAHVRGGGIYGEEWRRAGWKATKPNTWKDGIAVGEWLVAQGYTRPGKLSIYGGSAGGVFVGRAITERPDLFSAAVIAVGNTDSLRSETRANGAGNIPEYGTFTKEDEFRALMAMSTYGNVRSHIALPAVMFEHGVNDSRVDVWMTLKTASRMAASTTSGKPVLMRLEYDGGHGVGATRAQQQARTADRWTFLLWQAGKPEFQPVVRQQDSLKR